MRSWGWGPHDEISALLRGSTRELPHCLYHVKTQWSGQLKTRKRVLTRNWIVQHLPRPRIVRNKFLLFKPPSLWYFLWQPELTNITPLPRTTPRGQTVYNHWLTDMRSKRSAPLPQSGTGSALQYNSCSRGTRGTKLKRTPDETLSVLGAFPCPVLLPSIPLS